MSGCLILGYNIIIIYTLLYIRDTGYFYLWGKSRAIYYSVPSTEYLSIWFYLSIDVRSQEWDEVYTFWTYGRWSMYSVTYVYSICGLQMYI